MLLPVGRMPEVGWDMSNDANRDSSDNRDIQHDRDEQREMIENGRFGAAAREQAK